MPSFIQYTAIISCLFPVSMYIFRFKKLEGAIVLLAIYFLIVAGVETAGIILASMHKSNLALLNIFSLIEGIILLQVIRKLTNSPKAKIVLLLFMIVYILFWAYTTIFIISIDKFNTIENVLKGIFLILGSGFLLLQTSQNGELNLTQNWTFWFLAGILIYFSLTLVVYYSSSFVFNDNKSVMKLIWNINLIAVIIANSLFSYGFLCYFRKKSSYP